MVGGVPLFAEASTERTVRQFGALIGFLAIATLIAVVYLGRRGTP
jgi:hypothetical protein